MTPEFSVEDLRQAAVQRLLQQPPATPTRGDDDLIPPEERSAQLPVAGHKPAAVLVPLIERPWGITLLLTLRRDDLPNHAGQIAFPGGRRGGEETALAAALREAEEEVGLAPEFIDPLGYLDCYLTSTGFAVTPVVALVRPGFHLVAQPSEVAEMFEVPLAFLMSARNHQQSAREFKGRRRGFWAMPYEDRYIWGATAGMIRNLYERLS